MSIQTNPDHSAPVDLIHGRLLIDPTNPPEPGWIVIENARIKEVNLGPLPVSAVADHAPLGSPNHIITPTFTDAHFHFPQIDSIGCDGIPLLQWLDEIVFPAEGWWGKGAAPSAVRTATRRLLTQGTTTVAGYLTSHAEAATQAIEFLRDQSPLRIIAGRVAMDRNAPDDLTAEDRARATRCPIPSPMHPPIEPTDRIRVSVNPRFAISCTEELLAECAWAAKESSPSAWMQTHLAETKPECELVAELFPDDASYTAVYDRLDLLTDKAILGHCIHLSPAEWQTIAQRRSIVAHCPAANTFLQAGMFDLEAAREHDVILTLGSDVAAGPDIAMPRVARAMIEVAKMRKMSGIAPNAHIPSPAEAWSLITQGNARALQFDDTGHIAPGAAADLLLLHTPDAWHDRHLTARLIYNWSSSLITHRVIAGCFIDPNKVGAPSRA